MIRSRTTAWWRRRSLHTRLSLLVTAAVAVALVSMAALAWTAVGEIMRQQVRTQLETDTSAIAAAPDQWTSGSATLPGQDAGPDGHGHRRDLGPRWQILDASAGVVSESDSALPVTAGARAVAAGTESRAMEQVVIEGDDYVMLTVRATGGGAVQVAINEDRDGNTMTVLALLLGAACLVGIGVAALLARSLARAGLLPVAWLTQEVEHVATTQDLTRPIAVTGEDEIARLARSVNSMLVAIDASRKAQRALVEDAGHELRTPLTSLRTNIELLLEVERRPELAHRLPPEERQRLLGDLDAQVRELATLTTELVELSREEATREAIEPTPLADVVMAAVTRARTRAPGLLFATELEPLGVLGRPVELERMVLNVLDNAAKWSDAGETVETRLEPDGEGWARLTVRDSGPGIDPRDLPHVFDRFYRAEAARGRPGSGLGLAIVAQTAAQHGGTVEAGPQSPRGTVVTIRLPLKRFLGPEENLS